jgi:hypothetical protein
MSAAEKYGKSVESLSPETLQQVRSPGQTLADKGTVHQSSLGSGAPAPTPAMKYSGGSESLQREIQPPSQSR